MRNFKRKEVWLLLFFGGGFLLGILFINLWGDTYFKETAIFGMENLNALAEVSLDTDAFFPYLIKLRGKEMLWLWMAGYTAFGVPALLLVLGWLGMSAGVVFTSVIVQMGMTGILLFLALILPQAFLYVPAVWLLAEGIWERESEKQYIFLLLSVVVCVVAGAALESYGNPVLFRWIMKKIL